MLELHVFYSISYCCFVDKIIIGCFCFIDKQASVTAVTVTKIAKLKKVIPFHKYFAKMYRFCPVLQIIYCGFISKMVDFIVL